MHAQIQGFLKKLSCKSEVIALDGFYHKNQNLISVILKKMDQVKYIRNYEGYKKILPGFKLTKKISYYLRCYSHLLSTRNIDKKSLRNILIKKVEEGRQKFVIPEKKKSDATSK